MHCEGIDFLVVLHRSQLPILLPNKEKGGRIRGFGHSDISFIEFRLDEVPDCLIFCLIERVDLTVYRIGGSFLEFDCVIPYSSRQVSFRFFFAEHFCELLVFLWDSDTFGILLGCDGKIRCC